MRLRQYRKVHFDTLVEDRLKPRKCSKDLMAVQTERKERGVGWGGGGGSRARRKDLKLVNQPTPPRFRFIIMKYSTPFLFNITFTLYEGENIKYSLPPQTTSDAFKLPFV